MTARLKKELVLNNLNCANCAAKIENQVAQMDGVIHASMNFTTKTLTVHKPYMVVPEKAVKTTNRDIPAILTDKFD